MNLRELMKDYPSVAISIPTIFCFIQFVYEVVEIVKTGQFDSNMLSQLASSANGFETVCLFIIMYVLKDRKK